MMGMMKRVSAALMKVVWPAENPARTPTQAVFEEIDIRLLAMIHCMKASYAEGDIAVNGIPHIVSPVKVVALATGTMGFMVSRDVRAGGVLHVQTLHVPENKWLMGLFERQPMAVEVYAQELARSALVTFDSYITDGRKKGVA